MGFELRSQIQKESGPAPQLAASRAELGRALGDEAALASATSLAELEALQASLIGGLARLTQRTAELREREQSERLERLNCAVCLVEQRAVAYVPCGHVACCRTCAPKMDTCPLCKAVVRTRVPVYLP